MDTIDPARKELIAQQYRSLIDDKGMRPNNAAVEVAMRFGVGADDVQTWDRERRDRS